MSRGLVQSPPIHICFYSNRCDWSKAFLTELSQTPYKAEFRFVCVDPSPTRPQLPSWLKKVPTLVVSGEPTPRTDSDVMNWLYERRLKDGGGRGQNSGQGEAAGTGGQGQQNEPAPFVSDMGSMFGDSYSFVNQDTSAQGNGGLEGVNNFYGFSFLSGNQSVGTKEGSNIQMTASMSGGKRSKKEEMLDAQMEAFMASRNQGMPQMVKRM